MTCSIYYAMLCSSMYYICQEITYNKYTYICRIKGVPPVVFVEIETYIHSVYFLVLCEDIQK